MFKVPIKKGRKEEENVAFFDLDLFAVFWNFQLLFFLIPNNYHYITVKIYATVQRTVISHLIAKMLPLSFR